MDGVLCNFDKAYRVLDAEKADRKRFREAVMIHRIFEDLEFMPDTQELLNYVSKLENINIEILTSMGTFDVEQGNAAQSQKTHWLNKNNIPYKPNFVRSKAEKGNFAHDKAILIDDSEGCITPFNANGGFGILHKNSTDTIRQLEGTINGILGIHSLKYAYDSLGTYA